jgi:hypothetical protein
MGKSKKWKDRCWNDVQTAGWQFRTWDSKRLFQIAVDVYDLQGDGLFHLSVHLFRKALAFDLAFDGNKYTKPRISWRLIK